MHQPTDPTELVIRQATRADLPDIVRLLADDPLGKDREQATDPLPASYYVAFEAIDSDPRNELVVAELHSQVVGTLQLTFIPGLSFQGGTRAQIEAVRIDRRYRGQGLGEALLQWAIGRAHEMQCHLVQLTTNAKRRDAQRFYEHLGFVPSHIGMKLNLHTVPEAKDQR